MSRPASALLKDAYPELARQVVNKSLLPTLAVGANDPIEWECEKGHRWYARPYNRTNAKHPTACPICTGKRVIPGVNDLATLRPDVARLCANPEDATHVTQFSNKKLEWVCKRGHHYWSTVCNMTIQESRCPYCSGRLPIPGKTDLATTHPKIARELADQSLATKLKARSNRKVEWVCQHGHRYIASPDARIGKGVGCPYCAGRYAIPGVNDLQTLYPDLAKQLVDADPTIVSPSSQHRYLWRCENGHTWYAMPDNRTRHNSGCPVCMHSFKASRAEDDLADIIERLVKPHRVERNTRNALPSHHELDVYIPDLCFAVEYNGIFWHNELHKQPGDDAAKQQEAASIGLTLIQVWEDDWNNRRNVVIAMLARKLCATDRLPDILPNINPKEYERIGARRLRFAPVSGRDATRFLEDHHIQGSAQATCHFGLYDTDDELRAVVSLKSSAHAARQHRTEGTWEIQRYATCGIVQGGFTKLLAHATTALCDTRGQDAVKRFVTFSSNDTSNGRLYEATGFIVDKKLRPDYRYVGRLTGFERVPKEEFQLKRFKNDNQLTYEPGQTEHEAALANKIYRVYDCGKIRWTLNV